MAAGGQINEAATRGGNFIDNLFAQLITGKTMLNAVMANGFDVMRDILSTDFSQARIAKDIVGMISSGTMWVSVSALQLGFAAADYCHPDYPDEDGNTQNRCK